MIMSKNTKIWKPGQLVTIGNKIYRVKKDSFGCIMCENIHTEPFNIPCSVCIAHKHHVECMVHEHPFRNWILKELKPNK